MVEKKAYYRNSKEIQGKSGGKLHALKNVIIGDPEKKNSFELFQKKWIKNNAEQKNWRWQIKCLAIIFYPLSISVQFATLIENARWFEVDGGF